MKNTLHSIQLLRFIAAYLVVMMHSSQAIAIRMNHTPDDFWKFGTFGVDIFFIISGFVMETISKDKVIGFKQRLLFSINFLKRRLIRIAPLYWIYTTLKILVLATLPFLAARTTFDLFHIFSSYLFIPTLAPWGLMEPFLPVGWTLNFEMFFYLIFAISLLVSVNRIFIALFFFVLISVMAHMANNQLLTFYSQDIIFEFLVGMTIAQCYKRKWLVESRYLAVGILAITLSYLIFCYHFELNFVRFLRLGIPAGLLVYSLLCLEPLIKNNPTLLKISAYGDTSYTTYLLHTFIVPSVPLLLLYFGITSNFLAFVSCLALTFIMSYTGYYYFEKQLINRLN